MKGMFDEKGLLVVDRDGTLHTMICPFAAPVDSSPVSYCAGWCPHFGELEPVAGGNGKRIDICHGKVLRFEEFTDKRG